MATRPTWQGHLRLSLVTCPVALYSATSPRGDVRFNLINPKTRNRIKMITTDPQTGPVERSDLVKGYEVERGKYILLTEDEIRSVRLESTRTIDIERFVDIEEIDRLYWNDPYFLVPDGKLAFEAYGVIREAMARAGQIALGRVVLHTRERLLALEPRDNGIVAYSLRSHDEVRDVKAAFADIPDKKPDAQMVEIAARIIEQQAGPFDPTQFNDRYEDALRELIAEKAKGHELASASEVPEDSKVSDLMEALRSSLQRGAGPAQRRAPTVKAKAKPAGRRPATKQKAG